MTRLNGYDQKAIYTHERRFITLSYYCKYLHLGSIVNIATFVNFRCYNGEVTMRKY